MRRPTFSIITPNYNSGSKLVETVASVIGQAADFEYLIIDGASSDESLALARELAGQCDRIRVLSAADDGVYDAMNKGIREASGRYLYFLGAGDALKDGILQIVAQHLPQNNDEMIYGDVIYNEKRYDGSFDFIKISRQNICHQAIFYGRNLFEIYGYFNLFYPILADWDFNLKLFGTSKVRKKYVPIVIADYESGGLSDVGSDENFWDNRNAQLKMHYNRWQYYAVRLTHIQTKVRHYLRMANA